MRLSEYIKYVTLSVGKDIKEISSDINLDNDLNVVQEGGSNIKFTLTKK